MSACVYTTVLDVINVAIEDYIRWMNVLFGFFGSWFDPIRQKQINICFDKFYLIVRNDKKKYTGCSQKESIKANDFVWENLKLNGVIQYDILC